MNEVENFNIETKLLLEAVYQKYGYDFRDYSWASIKRRIRHRFHMSGLCNVSEMQHKLIYDREFFERLLMDLTINVTEMFRDPHFYKAIRHKVMPELAPHHFLKIWHAGCSTGEEAYSMAILLRESGLFHKTQLYATDMNEAVLYEAKQGIFPIDRMKQFTLNYQKSGGMEAFSDYYTARYDSAILEKSLRERIVFANHNLVTDGVFGEMQMIVCRNVLIYFNKPLRNHVLQIFYDSLAAGGFLCLGSKESVMFTEYSESFSEVAPGERIFRKI